VNRDRKRRSDDRRRTRAVSDHRRLCCVTLALANACGIPELSRSDETTYGDGTGTETAVPTVPQNSGETSFENSGETSFQDSGETSPPSAGETSECDEATSAATTGPVGGCMQIARLDVLFIGNSYTETFDLPGMVTMLGDNAEVVIHTESLTQRNVDLAYHLAQPITAEIIAGHAWDVVVLQGHSLGTIDDLDGFIEAGASLVDLVRQSGAEPLLYETWARKEGHELYATNPNTGGSPSAMQQIIREGYRQLSELTGAPVARVGDAWEQTIADHSAIELFAPDFHHPSLNGVYLSANVFFAVLTDMTPLGHVGRSLDGIEDEDAAALQTEAAAIVWPTDAP